jgi:hypothetical protein
MLNVDAKEQIIMILCLFVVRIILFSPILLVALNTYKNFLLRAMLIIILFLSVFGWARSNPLFSEQVAFSYDFAAVGFLALLYFLLSSTRMRGLFVCSVTLIIGQLFFENLGIVVGIATSIFYWAMWQGKTSDRFKMSFLRLSYMGLLSVMTVVVSFICLDLGTNAAAGKSQAFSLMEYFSNSYEMYGKENIKEIYDIVENIIELLAYPILGGIILALMSTLIFKDSKKPISVIRSEFWAGLSIWIGFMVTMIPAMFLSGLYYEMGRQLIPLACLTTIFVAKSVEYFLVTKIGSAHSTEKQNNISLS